MAKVTIDALAEVPEVLHVEYQKGDDGQFHLKLEGDIPAVKEANTKLAEFRDNNITLIKENQILKGEVKKFNGIDLIEYGVMKTKLESLEKKGGVNDTGDIEIKMRQAVADATAPLTAQLSEITTREAAATKKLAIRDMEVRLTEVARKAGIDDRAMPDFLSRGFGIFNLEGVATDGNGKQLFSKTRPADSLTLDEWATGLMTEAPHLFKQSRGGGAGGGFGERSGVRILNSNDPLEFGRNLEDIAKGKLLVNTGS